MNENLKKFLEKVSEDKALAEKLVEYRKNMAEEVVKKAARVEQQLG